MGARRRLSLPGAELLRRALPFLLRVQGRSMLPYLRPNDVLLVRPSKRLPRVGQLVVVRLSPHHGLWVKRVRSLGKSTFTIGSDNPVEGTDSRELGSLDLAQLAGVVSLCLPTSRIFTAREG